MHPDKPLLLAKHSTTGNDSFKKPLLLKLHLSIISILEVINNFFVKLCAGKNRAIPERLVAVI